MIHDNEGGRISGNYIINTFKVVNEQTQITEHGLWDCRQIIYLEHKGLGFESWLDWRTPTQIRTIKLDKKRQTGSEHPGFILYFINDLNNNRNLCLVKVIIGFSRMCEMTNQTLTFDLSQSHYDAYEPVVLRFWWSHGLEQWLWTTQAAS